MNNAMSTVAPVLRTFIEIFGANNIVVMLPKAWAGKYPDHVGAVKVLYGSKDTIEIHAEGGYIHICPVSGLMEGQSLNNVHIIERQPVGMVA